MLRLLLLVLAASVAACASPEPAVPQATSSPLTGSYSAEHEISVFDGTDWVDDTVADRLAVIERGDSLDVSFVLLHTNAHICEWHGAMANEAGTWTARETLRYNDNQECTLRLEVSADSLTLRDEGFVCRMAYCGARGSIDGIGFARSTREADTSWRDDLR
jgi:hypothetical protein